MECFLRLEVLQYHGRRLQEHVARHSSVLSWKVHLPWSSNSEAAHEPTRLASEAAEMQAVIILDWDDTLCPTTWAMRLGTHAWAFTRARSRHIDVLEVLVSGDLSEEVIGFLPRRTEVFRRNFGQLSCQAGNSTNKTSLKLTLLHCMV